MDSSFSPKDEIWFQRVCHHISNAVYLAVTCCNAVWIAWPLKTWPLGSPQMLVTGCVTSQKSEDLRLVLLVDWLALCAYIPWLGSGYLSFVIRLDARGAMGHLPAGQNKCFSSPNCPELFWSPSSHPTYWLSGVLSLWYIGRNTKVTINFHLSLR